MPNPENLPTWSELTEAQDFQEMSYKDKLNVTYNWSKEISDAYPDEASDVNSHRDDRLREISTRELLSRVGEDDIERKVNAYAQFEQAEKDLREGSSLAQTRFAQALDVLTDGEIKNEKGFYGREDFDEYLKSNEKNLLEKIGVIRDQFEPLVTNNSIESKISAEKEGFIETSKGLKVRRINSLDDEFEVKFPNGEVKIFENKGSISEEQEKTLLEKGLSQVEFGVSTGLNAVTAISEGAGSMLSNVYNSTKIDTDSKDLRTRGLQNVDKQFKEIGVGFVNRAVEANNKRTDNNKVIEKIIPSERFRDNDIDKDQFYKFIQENENLLSKEAKKDLLVERGGKGFEGFWGEIQGNALNPLLRVGTGIVSTAANIVDAATTEATKNAEEGSVGEKVRSSVSKGVDSTNKFVGEVNATYLPIDIEASFAGQSMQTISSSGGQILRDAGFAGIAKKGITKSLAKSVKAGKITSGQASNIISKVESGLFASSAASESYAGTYREQKDIGLERGLTLIEAHDEAQARASSTALTTFALERVAGEKILSKANKKNINNLAQKSFAKAKEGLSTGSTEALTELAQTAFEIGISEIYNEGANSEEAKNLAGALGGDLQSFKNSQIVQATIGGFGAGAGAGLSKSQPITPKQEVNQIAQESEKTFAKDPLSQESIKTFAENNNLTIEEAETKIKADLKLGEQGVSRELTPIESVESVGKDSPTPLTNLIESDFRDLAKNKKKDGESGEFNSNENPKETNTGTEGERTNRDGNEEQSTQKDGDKNTDGARIEQEGSASGDTSIQPATNPQSEVAENDLNSGETSPDALIENNKPQVGEGNIQQGDDGSVEAVGETLAGSPNSAQQKVVSATSEETGAVSQDEEGAGTGKEVERGNLDLLFGEELDQFSGNESNASQSPVTRERSGEIYRAFRQRAENIFRAEGIRVFEREEIPNNGSQRQATSVRVTQDNEIEVIFNPFAHQRISDELNLTQDQSARRAALMLQEEILHALHLKHVKKKWEANEKPSTLAQYNSNLSVTALGEINTLLKNGDEVGKDFRRYIGQANRIYFDDSVKVNDILNPNGSVSDARRVAVFSEALRLTAQARINKKREITEQYAKFTDAIKAYVESFTKGVRSILVDRSDATEFEKILQTIESQINEIAKRGDNSETNSTPSNLTILNQAQKPSFRKLEPSESKPIARERYVRTRVRKMLGGKIPKNIIIGSFSETANGQKFDGAYSADGNIYLNLDNLNESDVEAVLAEELAHSIQGDPDVKQSLNELLGSLPKESRDKIEKVINDFYSDTSSRVKQDEREAKAVREAFRAMNDKPVFRKLISAIKRKLGLETRSDSEKIAMRLIARASRQLDANQQGGERFSLVESSLAKNLRREESRGGLEEGFVNRVMSVLSYERVGMNEWANEALRYIEEQGGNPELVALDLINKLKSDVGGESGIKYVAATRAILPELINIKNERNGAEMDRVSDLILDLTGSLREAGTKGGRFIKSFDTFRLFDKDLMFRSIQRKITSRRKSKKAQQEAKRDINFLSGQAEIAASEIRVKELEFELAESEAGYTEILRKNLVLLLESKGIRRRDADFKLSAKDKGKTNEQIADEILTTLDNSKDFKDFLKNHLEAMRRIDAMDIDTSSAKKERKKATSNIFDKQAKLLLAREKARSNPKEKNKDLEKLKELRQEYKDEKISDEELTQKFIELGGTKDGADAILEEIQLSSVRILLKKETKQKDSELKAKAKDKEVEKQTNKFNKLLTSLEGKKKPKVRNPSQQVGDSELSGEVMIKRFEKGDYFDEAELSQALIRDGYTEGQVAELVDQARQSREAKREAKQEKLSKEYEARFNEAEAKQKRDLVQAIISRAGIKYKDKIKSYEGAIMSILDGNSVDKVLEKWSNEVYLDKELRDGILIHLDRIAGSEGHLKEVAMDDVARVMKRFSGITYESTIFDAFPANILSPNSLLAAFQGSVTSASKLAGWLSTDALNTIKGDSNFAHTKLGIKNGIIGGLVNPESPIHTEALAMLGAIWNNLPSTSDDSYFGSRNILQEDFKLATSIIIKHASQKKFNIHTVKAYVKFLSTLSNINFKLLGSIDAPFRASASAQGRYINFYERRMAEMISEGKSRGEASRRAWEETQREENLNKKSTLKKIEQEVLQTFLKGGRSESSLTRQERALAKVEAVRIMEERSNFTSGDLQAGIDTANELAFSGRPAGKLYGGLVDALSAGQKIGAFNFRGREWRPMKLSLPFVNIIGNVLKMGIETTPLGYVSALDSTMTLAQKRNARNRASSGMATMIGLMIAKNLFDDEEEGREINFHGKGNPNKAQRDKDRQSGWSPFSLEVKINGKSNYLKFGGTPHAIMLGALSSVSDRERYFPQESKKERFYGVLVDTASVVGEFGGLTQLKDIFGTGYNSSQFSNQDGEKVVGRYIQSYVNKASSMFIPMAGWVKYAKNISDENVYNYTDPRYKKEQFDILNKYNEATYLRDYDGNKVTRRMVNRIFGRVLTVSEENKDKSSEIFLNKNGVYSPALSRTPNVKVTAIGSSKQSKKALESFNGSGLSEPSESQKRDMEIYWRKASVKWKEENMDLLNQFDGYPKALEKINDSLKSKYRTVSKLRYMKNKEAQKVIDKITKKGKGKDSLYRSILDSANRAKELEDQERGQ